MGELRPAWAFLPALHAQDETGIFSMTWGGLRAGAMLMQSRWACDGFS